MFNKLIHFIKYNNATIIILAVSLILGGGAWAAGPEAIGQKQTSVQGLDNTALLAADLDNFNLDFKIENIQADDKYYYVTYSYLDLTVIDQAWQYQLGSKTQKISKKIKEDLGQYLAKYLAKHAEARWRELKAEKSRAQSAGVEKRVEVTEYSGLVGRTLDLAAKVFPGYEPVKKRELPAPNFDFQANVQAGQTQQASGTTDNLTQIYNDYIAEHPDLFTDSASSASSGQAGSPQATPVVEATSSPETVAAPSEPAPATTSETASEPASVEVIELPAPTAAEPAPEATPEPATEPAPEPAPTE